MSKVLEEIFESFFFLYKNYFAFYILFNIQQALIVHNIIHSQLSNMYLRSTYYYDITINVLNNRDTIEMNRNKLIFKHPE